MALTKCSECQAEVSDQAVNCPKCAFPIKKNIEKQKTSKVAMGCLTVIFLFFVLIVSGVLTSKKTTPPPPAVTFNEAVYDKGMKNFKDVLFKNGSFKSYSAEPDNNYKRITVVVSDAWYNTQPHIKERIVSQIGEAYAKIRISAGVPDSPDNFPKIIFRDAYGKDVAKSDTFGIKIYK